MNHHQVRMQQLIAFTRNNNKIEPYGCAIYNEDGALLTSTIGNKERAINII